jgi:hypothetical protein
MFSDQVTVVGSEDAQIFIHKVEKITSKYGLKISTSKMKTMAFKERDPVRSKTVINTNIIEQINTFSYLDCSISYHNEKDIIVKFQNFSTKWEIIKRTLKPSPIQKHTRLKIYNTITLPTLLYGSITWELEKRINPGHH